MGPVCSHFHWKSAIETEHEWGLHLKSRGDLFERVAELIRARHAYDLPAIVAHSLIAGTATARWIIEETGSAA